MLTLSSVQARFISYCEIVANDFGYLTAPSTYKEMKYGFIFIDCIIKNTSTQEIYLSRPWRNHARNAL